MAKINIVIADSDELFLKHLVNYLMEHMSNLDVCSFTTKESMIQFISERSNKIDVIAFTEDLMDGTITVAKIPAKIVMGDGSFSNLDDFESVNKYQKTEKFINDILMIYAEKTGHVEAVAAGDKETKLLGFFSPIGGSGKTTLALSLAYALGQQGKRVFYLNAERINSTVEILNQAPSGSLSDLYLTAKTKGANIGLRIIANKYTDAESNISYINPSESSLEINELTLDEFKKMLTAFETIGEFDYVIVDFDSEFSREKITMLSAMDRVYVTFTTEQTAISKMKLFVKELGLYDELQELSGKIFAVMNKSDQRSAHAVQNSGLTEICNIRGNIPLSPVLADTNTLLHGGMPIVQMMAGLFSDI